MHPCNHRTSTTVLQATSGRLGGLMSRRSIECRDPRAIGQVAAEGKAPLHLYCYNPYDQRVRLEALKRHLSSMALLSSLFDLLTQSPDLGHPIISFLAREVAERRHLGVVCAPLHDVVGMLGFDGRTRVCPTSSASAPGSSTTAATWYAAETAQMELHSQPGSD